MRIVISASSGISLINFRGKLIESWVKLGHEVICTSIEPADEMCGKISKLGASYVCIPGDRTGIGIASGLGMINMYIKTYQQLKPDILFLYMSKPVAFGGIAAIIAGIRNIYVFVTGLEIAFYSKGIKNYFIKTILTTLFRYVHKHCAKVFFMNDDDIDYMVSNNIVHKNKVVKVNSSGVDMEYFSQELMPSKDRVCMTARLIWSKGVKEYVEAAQIVRQTYPNIIFDLVGALDTNSEAVSENELKEIIATGYINYCGFAEDVRPYLKKCSIFVLPSYHEGNGKSIVEAESVGRPIVTTDAPGCRETVIDGHNGYKVRIGDSKALAAAIISILQNHDLKIAMANNSREYCKEKFDVNFINGLFNKEMDLLGR